MGIKELLYLFTNFVKLLKTATIEVFLLGQCFWAQRTKKVCNAVAESEHTTKKWPSVGSITHDNLKTVSPTEQS